MGMSEGTIVAGVALDFANLNRHVDVEFGVTRRNQELFSAKEGLR